MAWYQDFWFWMFAAFVLLDWLYLSLYRTQRRLLLTNARLKWEIAEHAMNSALRERERVALLTDMLLDRAEMDAGFERKPRVDGKVN